MQVKSATVEGCAGPAAAMLVNREYQGGASPTSNDPSVPLKRPFLYPNSAYQPDLQFLLGSSYCVKKKKPLETCTLPSRYKITIFPSPGMCGKEIGEKIK